MDSLAQDKHKECLDASVVICTYTEERWEDLVTALACVQNQSHPPREAIVVVDHNPRLADRVRILAPDFQILESTGRRGVCDARNTGVAAASGDIVAFLDDDASVERDWLNTLVRAYKDERVVGVGGPILPAWDGDRPAWFPEEFDWVVGCTFRGMATTRRPVGRIIGANMSFKRKVFERVGGFNSELGRVGKVPSAAEETEFCVRVRRSFPDSELMYEPDAPAWQRVPYHRGTWQYFRSRCYAEGVSKATVSKSVGSKALGFERTYVLKTLTRGIFSNIGDAALGRDGAGMLRAAAILAGLGLTTAGFLRGMSMGHKPPAANHDTGKESFEWS